MRAPHCLALTKDGHLRHPLYPPADVSAQHTGHPGRHRAPPAAGRREPQRRTRFRPRPRFGAPPGGAYPWAEFRPARALPFVDPLQAVDRA
uniref:hypothetical protein n=1 Tax=Amycolatopsis sp. CA-096443 TaxID=3239919 RepID=UPI003F49462C